MKLATVQRMRTERDGVPCIQYVEHRTRDLRVLFSEDVWGWSGDSREAFVFLMRDLPAVAATNDYERSAEFHVAKLKADGELNRVWSCHFNVPGAQERALRQASRLAGIEASVVPEPVVDAPVRLEVMAVPSKRAPARRGRRVRKKEKPVRPRVAPEEAYARLEKEGLA